MLKASVLLRVRLTIKNVAIAARIWPMPALFATHNLPRLSPALPIWRLHKKEPGGMKPGSTFREGVAANTTASGIINHVARFGGKLSHKCYYNKKGITVMAKLKLPRLSKPTHEQWTLALIFVAPPVIAALYADWRAALAAFLITQIAVGLVRLRYS